MSEYKAYIVVRCKGASQVEKLLLYLEEATRPDFSDEVPAGEASLFELAEPVPFPSSVNHVSSNLVELSFNEDLIDVKQELPKFLDALNVERSVLLMDSFDEEYFYLQSDGFFEFYYSAEPLESEEDELEFNRELSGEVLKGAINCRAKGKRELLHYLANL